MTWNTNTAILGRLKTFSDDMAWTSLVKHFEPPLERYARRAGLSASAVKDTVQETLVAFATAYRRGDYDRTKGRLSAWLYGIARHEVASALRESALGPTRTLSAEEERRLPDAHEDELERIWEEEWRRSLTKRCVERVRRELEPSTWKCFELQVFDGLTAEEVASRLSLSPAKVHDAKYRVSRRLRAMERDYEDV